MVLFCCGYYVVYCLLSDVWMFAKVALVLLWFLAVVL